MNISYLATFLEAVKLGGLNKAAHQLFLSQPSVTHQIQKLEQEVGCSLIDRKKGKFALTREGKRFFRCAEYIHQEYKSCLSEINVIRQRIAGDLTLIATPATSEFVLPPILNVFKSNNPYIDINLNMASSPSAVIEEVNRGKDILGFSSKFPGKDGLEAIKVEESNYVFIAYSGHPFTLKKEITAADIIGETLIIRVVPDRDDLRLIGLDLANYKPKVIMGSPTGVLSAVEAKLGIGLISRLAITKSEALGLVKVINVKNYKGKRDYYCMYRKDGFLSPLTKEFLKFIQNYSRDHGFTKVK